MISSKLRQVPDNQEVYIDEDGYTSIIFEITERVGEPGSSPEIDGKALTTHLEEIVGSDIDTVKVWNSTETLFSRLRYAEASIFCSRQLTNLLLHQTAKTSRPIPSSPRKRPVPIPSRARRPRILPPSS